MPPFFFGFDSPGLADPSSRQRERERESLSLQGKFNVTIVLEGRRLLFRSTLVSKGRAQNAHNESFCICFRGPQKTTSRENEQEQPTPTQSLFSSSTMPIKFNKETSTRLFRYVKSVDIKFNRKWFFLVLRIDVQICFVLGNFFFLTTPTDFDTYIHTYIHNYE